MATIGSPASASECIGTVDTRPASVEVLGDIRLAFTSGEIAERYTFKAKECDAEVARLCTQRDEAIAAFKAREPSQPFASNEEASEEVKRRMEERRRDDEEAVNAGHEADLGHYADEIAKAERAGRAFRECSARVVPGVTYRLTVRDAEHLLGL